MFIAQAFTRAFRRKRLNLVNDKFSIPKILFLFVGLVVPFALTVSIVRTCRWGVPAPKNIFDPVCGAFYPQNLLTFKANALLFKYYMLLCGFSAVFF